MEKICLDFEATVDFLRGDSTALEKLKHYVAHEEICISSFTLFQLLQTVRKTDVVNVFASKVTILPFDRKAARVASEIQKELDDQKLPTKRIEEVITAAICISNDAFLFSRTPSKYDGMKELRKV